MVVLKYLCNFWRTIEIPLINYKINLSLSWSASRIIIYTNVVNQNPMFEITKTKLYVPAITVSTQNNAKLLPQFKSGFTRTNKKNKYLSKLKFLT